jgi:hypothetical protein
MTRILRTYGRTRNILSGQKTWKVVTTDSGGFDDMVWLTTLAQVCKLNLEESPFYASWGIPAHASVMLQIPPDFYMALTQKRFAPYFLSLTMSRGMIIDNTGRPAPAYNIFAITNWGATLATQVPI